MTLTTSEPWFDDPLLNEFARGWAAALHDISSQFSQTIIAADDAAEAVELFSQHLAFLEADA